MNQVIDIKIDESIVLPECCDNMPENSFYMVGSMDEAIEKSQKK